MQLLCSVPPFFFLAMFWMIVPVLFHEKYAFVFHPPPPPVLSLALRL